jgi:catechol 2,3-dioxygenase-like lactoylglutathione lyase family enzyme
MKIEHVDFLSVHSTDLERSRRFYVDTLGLRFDREYPDSGFEVWAGQLCLGVWDPTRAGMEFQRNPASLALHVDDVEAARSALEAKGIEFDGETIDSGVCHMAFFSDPDGNAYMLHRRYAPIA